MMRNSLPLRSDFTASEIRTIAAHFKDTSQVRRLVSIAARVGVDYHERTVGKILKELGFSHVSARPRHPGQAPEAIETFKKTSAGHWRRRQVIFRLERPSKSGGRMKPVSARRTVSFTSGRTKERGPVNPRINATKTSICSAPSVPHGAAAPVW